ncbi:MAG: hypothetical protein N3A66_11245, partial [Planctomycetota bacterium]|nr:hypothetical protein [Planctomycetota bacterium]
AEVKVGIISQVRYGPESHKNQKPRSARQRGESIENYQITEYLLLYRSLKADKALPEGDHQPLSEICQIVRKQIEILT